MSDAFLENLVGGQADCVEHVFGFETFVDVRWGERRIAARIETDPPFLVAFHDRGQHVRQSRALWTLPGHRQHRSRSPVWHGEFRTLLFANQVPRGGVLAVSERVANRVAIPRALDPDPNRTGFSLTSPCECHSPPSTAIVQRFVLRPHCPSLAK